MSYVFTSGYSAFCCTETWLTDTIFDNEIIACGYCIFRKDRLSRGGGGVLIASIPIAEIESPRDLELVTVSIGTRNTITMCAVYFCMCAVYPFCVGSPTTNWLPYLPCHLS